MFKKIWKIISWVLVVLTVLSFVLMMLPPSGATAPSDPAAAQSFDQKLNGLAIARQKGQAAEARLSELEVNSKVQQLFAAPPASGVTTLNGMTVHFGQDRVVCILKIKLWVIPLYITLGVKPGVRERRMLLDVMEVELGRMPMPAAPVSEALRQKLLSPEGQEMMTLPDDITGIHVDNGELVIEAK